MTGASSRLDVRLLGPPEVAVDGAPLSVDTRKAVALLAYLVERDVAPTREELTWLLGSIQGWGTEKDAIYLESIAGEFPAMTEGLKEHAEQIRMHRRMMAAQEGKPELPADAEKR